MSTTATMCTCTRLVTRGAEVVLLRTQLAASSNKLLLVLKGAQIRILSSYRLE
jgi:hypothetical protein